MSKISTIYDKIVSVLGTVYISASDYTRIPNAATLEANPEPLLRKGFGFSYSGSSPIEDEFNRYTVAHVFQFVFTREVLQLDGEFSDFDTEHKGILEDIKLLTDNFYNQDLLNLGNNLEISEMGGASPIQFVQAGQSNFIYATIDITFTLKENISCT